MNIWKISLANIKSKPLYTFISIFTLAISIGLLIGIQQLQSSFKHQSENNLGNIDLVLGAKGSPLQLILASVLHLDTPTGNISFKEADSVAKNPMIKKAVPISYGDNYKGYRIVGTTNDFFTLYNAELAQGKLCTKSLEVVVGAAVAEKLNLSIGDLFLSSHGLIENDIDVHDDEFKVIGILKPTNKVIDRLIVTQLESIWDIHEHHEHEEDEHRDHKHEDHDHEGEHHEENHKADNHENEHREITSLLITFKNPRAILTLPRRINEKTNMQAALPKYEMDKLYKFTGIGFTTITWIAYLILLIASMIIFVSIYKMIKENAFDLALLRTFGASHSQLIRMVAYEGITIVLSAFLIGVIFIEVVLQAMLNFMQSDYQQSILVSLSFKDVLPVIGLVFVIIVIAISLAIHPILKMNVSKILSYEK